MSYESPGKAIEGRAPGDIQRTSARVARQVGGPVAEGCEWDLLPCPGEAGGPMTTRSTNMWAHRVYRQLVTAAEFLKGRTNPVAHFVLVALHGATTGRKMYPVFNSK